MDIAAKKVVENGGEEKIDIVNVKVPPELVGSLRLQKDIYPAYHMNKEHWVTVKLGGEVSAAELISLVDESYRLTV
ncbi:MAG: MmcQ/YjbR family DNA-binding protein, partial [Providencia sp.]|jgi:predicted DNA-binding protein (MmcQ/YjbR family)|nr:MmcQ/YjbR family DNA-binding protein [Providencia sp.]